MKRTMIYVGAFKLPSGNAAAQRVSANTKIFRDIGHRVILVGAESLPTSRRAIDHFAASPISSEFACSWAMYGHGGLDHPGT